jgi:hypothetical protein
MLILSKEGEEEMLASSVEEAVLEDMLVSELDSATISSSS